MQVVFAGVPMTHSPAWTPENRRAANRQLVEALVAVWDRVPDQRFGQFVMNLSREPGGFADTWEWNHGTWHSKLAHAQQTWASPEVSP